MFAVELSYQAVACIFVPAGSLIGSRKMYGMSLPDDVLKKVYYRTALRVFKGLPQSGWPQ